MKVLNGDNPSVNINRASPVNNVTRLRYGTNVVVETEVRCEPSTEDMIYMLMSSTVIVAGLAILLFVFSKLRRKAPNVLGKGHRTLEPSSFSENEALIATRVHRISHQE